MSETQYILLLRGVNVGGAGKLPMADLRKSLAVAGVPGAKTYIQSGNIVLPSALSKSAIAAVVKDVIETDFGFRPAIVVLTVDEFEDALRSNPFDVEDKKFLHLTFLAGETQLDAEGLRIVCTASEEFSLKGAVFYLATPNGYGRSKAAEKLDKHLIADVKTARNLNSCEKILALAKSL